MCGSGQCIRYPKLPDATVKLMDEKSPLDIEPPVPLEALKKPLLKIIQKTLIEKLLIDPDIIKTAT